MRVHEQKILRKLESLFNVEEVKYDIISKTFIYKHDGVIKEITFYTLLNKLEQMDLSDEQKDLYDILNSLNSSYFPRRLRQLFTQLYTHSNIELPHDLFITTKGISIHINSEIKYIQYDDDWNKMIKDFENIFNVSLKDKTDLLNIEEFKGEYHQK